MTVGKLVCSKAPNAVRLGGLPFMGRPPLERGREVGSGTGSQSVPTLRIESGDRFATHLSGFETRRPRCLAKAELNPRTPPS